MLDCLWSWRNDACIGDVLNSSNADDTYTPQCPVCMICTSMTEYSRGMEHCPERQHHSSGPFLITNIILTCLIGIKYRSLWRKLSDYCGKLSDNI